MGIPLVLLVLLTTVAPAAAQHRPATPQVPQALGPKPDVLLQATQMQRNSALDGLAACIAQAQEMQNQLTELQAKFDVQTKELERLRQ